MHVILGNSGSPYLVSAEGAPNHALFCDLPNDCYRIYAETHEKTLRDKPHGGSLIFLIFVITHKATVLFGCWSFCV